MGSNMQRQGRAAARDGIARLWRPVLKTAWRAILALSSSRKEAGKVASVTGSQIIITENGQLPDTKKKIKNDPEKGLWVYQVRKFMRSNAATCINQKILVKKR